MTGSSLHPAATDHLPVFITAPGQTDVLMVVMAIVLLAAVVGFGIFFFRLHSLPERMGAWERTRSSSRSSPCCA